LAESLKTFKVCYIINSKYCFWGLEYAFIEKKECSKEEKTFGQNREITQGMRAFAPRRYNATFSFFTACIRLRRCCMVKDTCGRVERS
jgi:hypothetical protein